LEDGSELFDEDTVGSVLENNFVVFAASQSAPQPQQAQTTQQSQLQAPAPKIQSQIPGMQKLSFFHEKVPIFLFGLFCVSIVNVFQFRNESSLQTSQRGHQNFAI
jgi:hypothetical protein